MENQADLLAFIHRFCQYSYHPQVGLHSELSEDLLDLALDKAASLQLSELVISEAF